MRQLFGMTIQDWEAMNATLLWINVKSGLLPLGHEAHGTPGYRLQTGTDVSRSVPAGRIRFAGVGRSPIRTQHKERRLLKGMKSVARSRRLRLLPLLRLVWSREKQID
jgi:hypothetical protein